MPLELGFDPYSIKDGKADAVQFKPGKIPTDTRVSGGRYCSSMGAYL